MPEVKHSQLNSYYRAYRDYTEAMKKVGQYENLKASLQASAEQTADAFSGSIAHNEVDMDWVTAIEDALPYIDKAIREQRRFIAQTEEVVPIERSKKVTTESVRHLAQHTNLIGKVEGDKVTPKNILNIQREESYAIYENRFLRTLLNRLLEFVGRCYAQLKETPERAEARIGMDRTAQSDNQNMEVSLKFHLKYNEEIRDFKISDDVSTMTEYERVIRLRKILSDFLSSALMRGLANTPEVRSPITRTNLLTKDQNFREALKLWEFFERYHKPGFVAVTEEDPGEMKPEMQDGVYDVFSMLQFVVKLNMSAHLRDILEATYQKEEEARLEALRLAEIEREKQVQARIDAAVETVKTAYEAAIAALNEAHEAEVNRIRGEWQEKYDTTVAQYEQTLADEREAHAAEIAALHEKYTKEIAALKALYESEIAALHKKYTDEITALKEAHAAEVKQLNDGWQTKYDETVASYEQTIAAEREAHAAEVAALNEKYTGEIDSLKEAHAAEVKQLNDGWQTKYDETVAQYEQTLTAERAERVAEVAALNEKYNDEIKVLNEKYTADTAALNEKYSTEIAALNEKHEAERNRIINEWQEKFTAAVAAYEAKLAEERKEHRLDNEAWQDKYQTSVNTYEDTLKRERTERREETARTTAAHAAEVTALQTEMQYRVNDTQTRLEAVIAERENKYSRELAQKDGEYRTYIESLNEEYDFRIQSMQDEHTAERTAMQKQAEQALQKAVEQTAAESRATVGRLETKNAALTAQLAQLQKQVDGLKRDCKSAQAEIVGLNAALDREQAARKKEQAESKVREDKYEAAMAKQKAMFNKNMKAQSEKYMKRIGKLTAQVEALAAGVQDTPEA